MTLNPNQSSELSTSSFSRTNEARPRPQIQLEDEYEILHVIQEGWRGRLLLVEHRRTRHEVVLKAVHKDSTARLDFFREFHYNYYLSPHKNILNAYDVAFEADDYYVFAQELATFGDLTTNMTDVGLGEINTKKVALQLASALEFMHSKDLVHRDINMDNILVFNSDFSWVKLCDFGSTRKTGTLLKKRTVWLPYAPPEIVDAVQNEGFHADTSQDVWQLGILVYVLLTGQLPWQKADLTDPNYAEYINWRKRRTLRTPKRFTNFTSRLLRMFKRMLEPKPEKRCSVREIYKYADDKWLVRTPRRDAAGDVDGQSVCYSTFSMHSCPKEKDRVLRTLKAHGIETTVDRIAKRQRIHEWLERSLSTRNLGADDDEALKEEEQEGAPKEGPPRALADSAGPPSLPGVRSKPREVRVQYEQLAALTLKMAQAKAAAAESQREEEAQPAAVQDVRLRNGFTDASQQQHQNHHPTQQHHHGQQRQLPHLSQQQYHQQAGHSHHDHHGRRDELTGGGGGSVGHPASVSASARTTAPPPEAPQRHRGHSDSPRMVTRRSIRAPAAPTSPLLSRHNQQSPSRGPLPAAPASTSVGASVGGVVVPPPHPGTVQEAASIITPAVASVTAGRQAAGGADAMRYDSPSPPPARRGSGYHRRRHGSSHHNDSGYDLQRSKTDSYITTGSTPGGVSRQMSHESESSDASMTSMQPGALR
nr:LOW QUALITY PROTEIN: serine/threonine-protein kinase SRK2B-like [Penaeus vannamei]